MQRFHEEDLVGHVQGLEEWTVVNIPAIATEETECRLGDGEDHVYVRAAGELIENAGTGPAEELRGTSGRTLEDLG